MGLTTMSAGVVRLPVSIANVYLVGSARSWVLVDSGIPSKARMIRTAAESLFGPGTRPAAIVLTHGHFDHAGSADDLAELWDVPVYAHRLELPFLEGRSPYPPKDPTVGGAMAFLSRFFPSTTVTVGRRLYPLPDGGGVPEMPGWKWIHTPGHAPGNVAFWNEADSVLLPGDAFTTVDLDSPVALVTQPERVCRPPAVMTCDWVKAHESVKLLADLNPAVIGAGHGAPMWGSEAAGQLNELARNFPAPAHGRYAHDSARTDETGITYLPPPVPDPFPKIAWATLGVAAIAGTVVTVRRRRNSS